MRTFLDARLLAFRDFEAAITTSRGPDQPYLVRQYNMLSKEAQMEVRAFIEFKAMQEADKKKTDEE